MSEKPKVKNHIHCKECGSVIEIDTNPFNNMKVLTVLGRLEIASEELGVCKNCIIHRGIVYYNRKKK